MSLKLGSDVLHGTFSGLDDDGSLLLTIAGTLRRFTTGEVLTPNQP
jgi:biotin-(acetyl-CoA carboxylase) ligase